MQFSSLGNLAQSLISRQQNASLKSELARLTSELVTGKTSDLGKRTGGDFAPSASITRELELQDAYSLVRAEVKPRLDATQGALEAIQNTVGSFGTDLLAATTLDQSGAVSAQLATSREKFDAVVSYLNSSVGGVSLFAGTEIDGAALASSDDILASLTAATATATTGPDFEAAMNDWFFSAGGGFETDAYQGGPIAAQNTQIGPNTSVKPTLTADADEIRQLLKDLASVVLISEGALTADPSGRDDILIAASEGLINGRSDIIDIQANIGLSQEALETAEARSAAIVLSLTEAQSRITSVDTYEVASRLEEVQLGLESLYLITAKTSRLNLTEYLR
ncbi:flagellin N-terminal helical domain-containing protein [Litoreibacter roseus]|uniref:Flagellin n=1 Tax=Litoreibacter roseus TaxID=2601869 RepID=A0A6N6JEY8_9RHOB|nr:flagellin [Litoreibacter roseus]GFE64694.1 flagellin [Litoreibacter roseus]